MVDILKYDFLPADILLKQLDDSSDFRRDDISGVVEYNALIQMPDNWFADIVVSIVEPGCDDGDHTQRTTRLSFYLMDLNGTSPKQSYDITSRKEFKRIMEVHWPEFVDYAVDKILRQGRYWDDLKIDRLSIKKFKKVDEEEWQAWE
jgi:hypothetical protein